MATNNSSNQDYSNETDGFILGGGSTKRDLTVTGADITLTGSGSNTYTFPSATDTLVGRDSTDTLTNKTLTSPKINENVAVTATATELNVLDGITPSTTELNYVNGVTSAIQTQLNAKASSTDLTTHTSDTTTHGATGAVVGTTNTQTLTNKTLTSPVLNTGVSGTGVKDEDDMASNSATHLATQQSIKAYVDAAVATHVRMDYTETTDLFSGTSFTASTWTDLKGNQNFTVGSSTSTVIVSVRGAALVGTSVAGMTSRLVIDSGGTPIYKKFGGSTVPSGGYANPLGSGVFYLTGLSAGVHTIKVQMITEQNSNVYLRCASREWEHLAITIVEAKG